MSDSVTYSNNLALAIQPMTTKSMNLFLLSVFLALVIAFYITSNFNTSIFISICFLIVLFFIIFSNMGTTSALPYSISY